MADPKVSPTDILNTHPVSLSNAEIEVGMKVSGGVSGIIEVPRSASTIHISGGRSKYGDFGSGMAQIGQETWVGGRGLLNFYLDPTRYFDSYMATTVIDGKLFPGIQWRYGEGYKAADNKLPGAWHNGVGHNVLWQSLADDRYANTFAATSSYNALNIELWVKKVGTPSGSLTIGLYSDSAGEPNAALKTATITASDIGDYYSELVCFAIASQALVSGTDYWIVAYDSTGGSTTSHWEVGYTTGHADQAMYSTDDGTNWLNTDNQLLFRVSAVAVSRRFYFFEFRGALYAIDRKTTAATASQLYINGSRGEATAGGATTLTDTDQAWTADEWIGSWVKITEGTGAGQEREITDNTTTALTVATWDTNPSTDSLYVIYSTDKWTDISPSAGDEFDKSITGAPLVADDVVFFPRGQGTAMIKMQYNEGAGTPAHEFRDEAVLAQDADIVYGFTDTTNKYQVFCATNDDKNVARLANVAYASNLASPTNIQIGDKSADITNMHDYNGYLYVFKEDGLYRVESDKALREDTGLAFFRSENTGEAVANRNFFMYFSWAGFSLQQLQKNSSLIDMASVGPDKGEGLPANRTGRPSSLGFHPAGLFMSVDGGSDNFSSVLVRTDPVGWHEIFRAPREGMRIRNVHFQDCPGTRPRLWIDTGDGIVFQEWPKGTLNPLKDTGIYYQHETSLTMSDIDMGAPTLPKALKALKVVSENLSDSTYVSLEYQTDDDIGEDTWITKGNYTVSPSAERSLNIGNIRKVRMRLRMQTEVATIPPIIIATVLEGFARTPVKYDWTFRVDLTSTGYTKLGTPEKKPQEVRDFLRNAANNGDVLYMRSIISDMDNLWVVVEPFVSRPKYKENTTQFEGYEIELTVREY